MFFDSFVLNGRPHGEVASGLSNIGYDPGFLRPYLDNNGRRAVTITQNGKPKKAYIDDLQARGMNHPVWNATSLRKEEWIELDRKVILAARLRLKAWTDLAAANSFGGFNGMAKMTLEYEAQSDPGEAIVDMDALSDGRADRPLYSLRSLPLPITHSDFFFSERQLAVSRNSNTPLDTTTAEACGRRIAEKVEKTTIGIDTGITYGTVSSGPTAHDSATTSTVYGYRNFPQRLTKTNLTTPTGTNPEAVMADVIAMRESLYANRFYGPFVLYNSTSYDQYLDNDYFRTGSTAIQRTLRQRLMDIDGIVDVRRLDWLDSTYGYELIMVQMTSDVARAVVGMDLMTVQWPSQGGMRQNFKTMCIYVPQLRSDYNHRCGILHGTTS